MSALAGTDVPVAKTYALCEDAAVIGTAFYVMEYVEGRILWDPTLPGMTPPQRAAHYDELNRVIAALHRSTTRPWASPTTAGPAITSSGRSRAGRSSTRRPPPSGSRRWTG